MSNAHSGDLEEDGKALHSLKPAAQRRGHEEPSKSLGVEPAESSTGPQGSSEALAGHLEHNRGPQTELPQGATSPAETRIPVTDDGVNLYILAESETAAPPRACVLSGEEAAYAVSSWRPPCLPRLPEPSCPSASLVLLAAPTLAPARTFLALDLQELLGLSSAPARVNGRLVRSAASAAKEKDTKKPSRQGVADPLSLGHVLDANRQKVKGWNRIAERPLPGWNSIPNASTLGFEDALVKLKHPFPALYQEPGETAPPGSGGRSIGEETHFSPARRQAVQIPSYFGRACREHPRSVDRKKESALGRGRRVQFPLGRVQHAY